MIEVKDLVFVNNNTTMLVKFGGYEAKYTVTEAKVEALKTWLGEKGKQHMEFYKYLADQNIPEVLNQPNTLAKDAATDENFFEVTTDAQGIKVIKPRVTA